MLVLSRKIGEKLVINGNIVVTIIGFPKGKVRLGFDAPIDVIIMRQELTRRKLNDKDDRNEGASIQPPDRS